MSIDSRTPRVSIGIPVYNGEEFLQAALDSVLSQSFTDLEVIICDNASTDRTETIARDYAQRDPRVRYHRSEKNLGAARNFNRAFGLARGQFFRWVAADDILHNECIAECVAALEEHPDAVLAFSGTVYIGQDGRELGLQRTKQIRGISELRSYNDLSFFELVRVAPACIPIFVFGLARTEALARTRLIGGYVASDLVIVAELRLLGRFVEIPRDLFYQRIHPRTTSRGSRNRVEGEAEWFDPRNKGKRFFPAARLMWEHIQGARHVRSGLAMTTLVALSMVAFGERRASTHIYESMARVWSEHSLNLARRSDDTVAPLRAWVLFAGLRRRDWACLRAALRPSPLGPVLYAASRFGARPDQPAEELLCDWLKAGTPEQQVAAAVIVSQDPARYRAALAEVGGPPLSRCLQRIPIDHAQTVSQLPEAGVGLGAPTTILSDPLG